MLWLAVRMNLPYEFISLLMRSGAKIDVTEANVQTLLPAANLLQLIDVRDACCEFLVAQLHPTNALGIKVRIIVL